MQQSADATEERIQQEDCGWIQGLMRMSICTCVRMCVCSREATKYLRMREDKSFSSVSNLLIFHECLFDVLLNIHVFVVWRKTGNDAKKNKKNKNLPNVLWHTLRGSNTVCIHNTHSYKKSECTLLHVLCFALTRHFQWRMDKFLPVTALLFRIRLTVGAAEQKVDKIKIESLAQHQLFQVLSLY